MKAPLKFVIFTFIYKYIAIAEANNVLKCYNCNPNDPNCMSKPENTTQEACYMENAFCISSYINSNSNGDIKSGVYRSCVQVPVGHDACQFLKSNMNELDSSHLVSCTSCNTSLCNRHQMRDSPLECYYHNSTTGLQTTKQCQRKDGSLDNFACISTNIINDLNTSGPYRDCVDLNNIIDPCDNFDSEQRKTVGLKKSCNVCRNDLCNNHTLPELLQCRAIDPVKRIEFNKTCNGGRNEYVCLSAILTSKNDFNDEYFKDCYQYWKFGTKKPGINYYFAQIDKSYKIKEHWHCANNFCNDEKMEYINFSVNSLYLLEKGESIFAEVLYFLFLIFLIAVLLLCTLCYKGFLDIKSILQINQKKNSTLEEKNSDIKYQNLSDLGVINSLI